MCSKITEALTTLGLLEKYKTKFEEEDVDDWVVEQWLQDSSFNELKTVIATSGDRMRFVRAFQQLSFGSSTGLNHGQNSSSAPQPSSLAVPESTRTGSTRVIDETKTSEESAALDMMEKEFQVPLEILQSSKYFVYLNVMEEVEKIKTNLKGFFPTFLTPEHENLKVETEFRKNSTAMRKFDNENRQRRMEAQGQIEKLFETLWKSEFQRLKQTAQKSAPKPFLWIVDLDKLHLHFDAFLKSLVTSNSPGYDRDFQKECQETCKQKIEELCTTTNYSSSVVNEYSRHMKIELENAVCIDTEPEFDQLHKTILSRVLKRCSNNPTNDVQKNAGSNLDDLTNSIILDYERKFREDNNEIRKEEAQIAQQAMDFALRKYVQLMDKQMSQGPGVFTKFEISEFHKVAYEDVNTFFTTAPNFECTYGWKTTSEKLDKKLKELEKDYQEKNNQLIEKNKLQRQLSFSAAENEYRKLMNGFISTQGQGKSLSQDKLEKCHKEAVQVALKLYADKMKGVKEDTKKIEESLVTKFEEERKQLVLKNDEKVARMLKEKEEAKLKEKERRNQNVCVFEGGIAIHFNESAVNVGSFQQQTGFTTICQNVPPCIVFTPREIFIGTEAQTLCADGQASMNLPKFDLFDLLQSGKNDAIRLVVHNRVEFLRPEEIFAVFLHQLSLLISNVHPGFHPSSCHVEFVISPFLRLPAKHMIKNSLNLAGFTRAHILQATSAMALTYFHQHPQNLEQNEKPCFIIAIHSSPSTFDVAVFRGSGHKVTSWRQTGLPYIEKDKVSVLRAFYFSKELIGGSSGDTKVLKGLLKSVLRECRLRPTDIQQVIPVIRGQNRKDVLQNIVEEVFGNHVQVFKESVGILQGAAALAAWKAGLPIFSQRFTLEETHPYFLSAVFSKQGGGPLNYPLIDKNDPCGQETRVDIYTVPKDVSLFSNKIRLYETNNKTSWEVAEFQAGNDDTKITIIGTRLEFHISPEGLIDVQWPPGYPLMHPLPIRSKTLWLDKNELENARRTLEKIFSVATGSSQISKLEGPKTPVWQSSFSPIFSKESVPDTTTITQGLWQAPGQHGSSSFDEEPPVPAEKECDQERKALESLSREVKTRLDNSPSTSSLVRDPIEELLQEIERILSQSLGIDVELIKSYKQKLEIRAKRIK